MSGNGVTTQTNPPPRMKNGAQPIATLSPASDGRAARCSYPLEETPNHLRERYRRLVLVSLPRHLDALKPEDTDTLVVAHSWLLWQEALAEGRHCVQYESASLAHPPADQQTDIHVRCNDWLFVDGVDPTDFRGVSLGCRFSREIGLLIMERERLARALESLIARYRPEAVIYIDFRADHSVMDADGRFALVTEIAERHGIAAVDRRDPPAGDDPWLPFTEFYGREQHEEAATTPRAIVWARAIFVAALGAICVLRRRVLPRKSSVFVANTHLTALPLIENFHAEDFYALFLAEWFPRKRDMVFLFRCLVRGMLPASSRRPRLNGEDLQAIARIEETLERVWQQPPLGHDGEIRRYVRERIIAPKRLHDMAVDVKWVERILIKHRPDLVISDGLDYYLSHMLFIVAKRMGIPTAASWHAHYIQDVKMGILGSDPRIHPAIDYFLTWGRVNEAWLDAVKAKTKKLRTGCPVVLKSRLSPTDAVNRGTVLLLQYVATGEDHIFAQGAQYPFFIEAVRMLRDLGFQDIRVKVHPGPYSDEHYRMVADAFALDCAIYKNEPFGDLLAWADIVIGPVVSGAMIEVLGAGKPYYPVLLPPHAVNTKYLARLPVFTSIDELRTALEDDEPPDFGALLEDFASVREIPNAAHRTWKVLRDILDEGSRP